MTKEFVPYELALKLKQLGFDEPCFGLYAPPSKTVFLHHYGLLTAKEQVLAPLFQQAFRWFREKEFLIDVTSLNSNEYEFYIQWSFAYSHLSDIYKTYEEAELACLEKLIEIDETKQQEQ
jgi:hypothetical protein